MSQEKYVAVGLFDQQIYVCEKAWLIIFQVDKVQNPLRADLQKRRNEELDSVRASKYQQGAGLVVVARLLSKPLSVVSVDSMVEQFGNKRFREERCSLAVADDRHRR